jgi:hypothetical protein
LAAEKGTKGGQGDAPGREKTSGRKRDILGHRWQRNRPEEPAAKADFGERFGQPCGVFFGEKREGRERGEGAL